MLALGTLPIVGSFFLVFLLLFILNQRSILLVPTVPTPSYPPPPSLPPEVTVASCQENEVHTVGMKSGTG